MDCSLYCWVCALPAHASHDLCAQQPAQGSQFKVRVLALMANIPFAYRIIIHPTRVRTIGAVIEAGLSTQAAAAGWETPAVSSTRDLEASTAGYRKEVRAPTRRISAVTPFNSPL